VLEHAPRMDIPLYLFLSPILGALTAWSVEFAESPVWLQSDTKLEAIRIILSGAAVEEPLCQGWARLAFYACFMLGAAGLLHAYRPRGVESSRPSRLRWAANAGGIGTLTVLALGALSLVGWRALRPPLGRGVVLIVVDTLRADHLGAYGYDRPTSPGLDAFMKGATLYRNAVSAAPWTAPATSALLSSHYPSEVSWVLPPMKIPPKVPMLAELFRNGGYRTGAVVSHHYVAARLNFDQGVRHFDDSQAQGHHYVSSPTVTQKGIRFLERFGDEPFFLMLHYFDPHFDYILHPPYDFYPDYEGDLESGQDFFDLVRRAENFDEDDINYIRALYDSEIRFTDDFITAVLDKLKAMGIYDQLTIVFTADHGEEFFDRGDHHIGHAHSLYQELLHVPLAVKYPGQKEGIVIDEPVATMDVVPTLVARYHLKPPAGRAFRGIPLPTRPGEAETTRPIFSEMSRISNEPDAHYDQSVRIGRWKFIRTQGADTPRLYNLDRDPREEHNLAAIETERAQAMNKMLDVWQESLEPFLAGELDFEFPEFTEEEMEQIRALGYVQ